MITQGFLHKLNHNVADTMCLSRKNGILLSVMTDHIDSPRMPQDVGNIYFEQGKTGYCWLSAALFCIAQYLKRKRGISYDAFSKTYLIFYDKLEKANKFLDFALAYASSPLSERNVTYILNNAMTDKGQWAMAENIITKYGLIPHGLMADVTADVSTGELNACLNYMLRYYAMRIRSMYQSHEEMSVIRDEKEKALLQIYKLLVSCYGKPPEKITVPEEFDGQAAIVTPMEFFDHYVKFPFENYSSICSNGWEDYVKYEIELDGNVAEGKRSAFFSLPDDIFDAIAAEQIWEEHFCWFTCDAGKFYIKGRRLFDEEPFDLADLVGRDGYGSISRKEVCQYCMAAPTHAMVFVERVRVNGRNYFIAHDSSAQNGSGAYCSMSESWFGKYVFQAVVENKYLEVFLGSKKCPVKKVKPWEFFQISGNRQERW